MENIRIGTKVKTHTFAVRRTVLHLIISFMLGRVFLLDCISPFAMSYMCSYVNSKQKTSLRVFLTAAVASAGILTTEHSHMVLKHLLTYVMFGLIYISVTTVFGKKGRITAYSSAAAATLIAGIIYYAQMDNLIYNTAMLLAECAAGFVMSFIIGACAEIICGEKSVSEIKTEDTMGIYVLSSLIITGFCGLYIGNISVGRAISGLFLMVTAYSGGCPFATTCGVGMGILNSLYAFELNEYAGVFGFCGLCAGFMSKFRRPGIILGFIVSSKLLSAYFGGWSDSVFTDFEIIIAICMFCLIPNSVLIEIKSFMNAGTYRNTELQKSIDSITAKMKSAARSFSELADLSGKIFGDLPPNNADISSVYDATADKLCRTCGLKFICWEKEVFDTRDALNKLTSVLSRKNYVESSDVPDIFRQKCIKYETFVNELNRTYCRYKIDNQWRNKVTQSRKLISMQLDGMSDIVDKMSESLEENIIFDKTNETKIYCMLEQKDIKCTDVTVVKNAGESSSVTVTAKQKNTECTQLFPLIEETVSSVIGKSMAISNYNCARNKYVFKLAEKELYKVECSYVSMPKSGENQCGDSITHGRIAGGKYTVILSDGMGCGPHAAKLSESAIELMRQFLNAGFDRKKAVGMIGSAIMINNAESFATIDALIIDLFTAHAEFIKAGANTTYIKSGNIIRKISSNTLPIGIIDNTESESTGYSAKDGDIIIMISDGIHNAADNWFEDYVLNMHEDSPKIIAQLLSDEAARNKKQDDDMTVAVVKITKA